MKTTLRLWKIAGVSKSGHPVTVKVRAANHAEALKKAGSKGYGVIRINDCVLQDGV